VNDRLAIRRASGGDTPDLLALIAEHAAFERLPYRAGQRPASLARALDDDPPLLHAWIASIDAHIVGYASATRDFSTLDGAAYLHMDCLYVRDGWRGRGIGLRLWEAVCAFARSGHCAAIQWQTPWWNADAARFYRRLGATEAAKLRYCLPLDGA
jgi:GNAT superfamily N-acetyltransferase